MTVCEKCAQVIEGTVVMVTLSTGTEYVCNPCWLDFLHFKAVFEDEEGQQSLNEYTR